MSERSDAATSLADLALCIDLLLLTDRNRAIAGTMVEFYLDAREHGDLDILPLPSHPDECDVDNPEIVLAPEQTVTVMVALHTINCPNVERAFRVPDQIMPVPENLTPQETNQFRLQVNRALRWQAVLNRIRLCGEWGLDWCKLQFRRFECILAPCQIQADEQSLDNPQPPPGSETIPLASPLCAPDLARHLRDRGLNRATNDAVDAFLRRYRNDFPDCFVPIDRADRRRNSPRYLYRPEVLPALVDHFREELP